MLATLPIPASTSCDNNSSSSHNHHPHQSYDDDAQQPQQQQQQPKHNSVVAIEEETPSVRSIATATTTRRTAPDTATATSTQTEGALLSSSSSSAMQVSLQPTTTTAAAVPSPSSQGKLRTLKRLYGRADEQRTILEAFQRAIEVSDEANFILIQGDEGSGKTAVAQQSIEAQVIQNGGFFVTWKFNQVSPMESGDGFVQAFTSLTNQIMNSHDTVLQEIRRNLQSMGMVDLAIILEVMPMLQPVIGITQNLKPPNGVESSGRHMQIFRNMLRAMCTKDRPLVMFFDDVHFVDSCTITLLESIITDTQNDGAVFMASMGPTAGTANTNQPRADLHKLIQGFHEGGVNVTTIDLPPLNEQTTNLMVADILHVDCDISAPMTKFLHHYTQGNPRFLTELLTLMYDNGILVFEESTKTWNCDETKIDSIYQECRDFTTLVQSKLNRLAKPVKDVLKAAACFGSKINVKFLDIVISKPVTPQLLLAVSSGLVIPIDDNCEYCFATTSVREAAYSLIPSNEREAFHLTLARKLWRAFTEEELNEHHSVLLGQLKLGVNKMTNLHERTATATLCLHAAQEAVKWAMFPSAAENLDFGLGLLCDQSWNTDYELTLALHNMAAEVGYVLGDFSKVQERVEAVLVNAHILDHTFQAYGVRLNILSATGNAQEAIDMGLHILNQIGEVIPPNPKPLYVQREYIRSRRLMKSKSSEMIRRLPSMTNHRKAAAMQIINLIVLPSLMGRPNLLPVLATRATRITVEHGLCNLSSLAFAIYGMVLTGAGEIHEAIRYGELALELLECFGVKQWLPRVYVCVYGCIFGWTKNLSSCIENLDRAFDVGIETGDVEFAFMNANLRNAFMLCMGYPLPVIKRHVDKLMESMVASKQSSALILQQSLAYMIDGFMDGDCENAIERLVHVENEVMALKLSPLTNCWHGFKRLLLAYVMRDYARAGKEAELFHDLAKIPIATIDIAILYLFDTIARLACCKETGSNRKRTLRVARSNIAVVSKFAEISPQFCLGFLCFMKAEVANLRGKHRKATNQYLTSIALLNRMQIYSFQAIACERAGLYMIEHGKPCIANDYLCESLRLYEEWGAKGKCDDLRREMAVIFGKGDVAATSVIS